MPTELIDMLPAGYYELDEHDRILYADDTWLEMHDVSKDEAMGEDIHQFYADPGEADTLRENINAAGFVKGETRLLKKKKSDGWFYGSIYAVVKRDESGGYAGRKGAVLDTTRSEMYKRITDDMSIGFYLVRTDNGRHSIAYCNKAFAEMFGFKDPREAIGWDISSLYQRREDHHQFFQKINGDDKQRDSSTRLVDVKTIDGRLFVVEATVQWEKNEAGQVAERSGVVRDLSKDEPLIELRRGFGSFLHTYSSNLTGIRLTLESIRRGLELDTDPFWGQRPTQAQRLQAWAGPTTILTKELKIIENIAIARNLSQEITLSISDLHESLSKVEEILPEIRVHQLQEIALTFLDFYPRLSQEGRFPKETLKTARAAAIDLLRVINLILLHDKERDVLEIDPEVHLLRESITEGLRHADTRTPEKVDLWQSIAKAMSNLGAYAQKQGVSFRTHNLTTSADVWAVERDLLRAIANLLHNAIKYSWQRSSGVFVRIVLSETATDYTVLIENYGVPVPPDEIQSVFEYGVRSTVAGDRNRIGTGIGLHDARVVIEKMGGHIELESHPPIRGQQPETRHSLIAHLTTVTVTLPKSGQA